VTVLSAAKAISTVVEYRSAGFGQPGGDHLIHGGGMAARSDGRGGGVTMCPMATCSSVLPGNGC
jgi:hypothetical protein